MFQSYNLIPHQTVLANVELALTISGVSKSERRRRAKEALERAQERLRQKQSIQEYYHTKASLARAMNRLKVSREKNTRI